MTTDDRQSLRDIVGDAKQAVDGRNEVEVRAIVDALGSASGTALLFFPAAVAATPLSGIPGLSMVCGIIIAVISLQLLIGRDSLWLPEWVLKRTVDGKRMTGGLGKLERVAGFLDRHTSERLTWMTRGAGLVIMRLICLLAGAIMPALEFIPFTGSIVASMVAFFSIAMLTGDGIVALVGLALVAGGGALAWRIF